MGPESILRDFFSASRPGTGSFGFYERFLRLFAQQNGVRGLDLGCGFPEHSRYGVARSKPQASSFDFLLGSVGGGRGADGVAPEMERSFPESGKDPS
jgi:hypothetical protein